jgi:hypothetical protein
MVNGKMNDNWIVIRSLKKLKDAPSEVKIDRYGNVFLDGKIYDGTDPKYNNLSVSVEMHNKLNTGEETQRMMEEQKKAKKGETVVIKDVSDPNKTETTTVKF